MLQCSKSCTNNILYPNFWPDCRRYVFFVARSNPRHSYIRILYNLDPEFPKSSRFAGFHIPVCIWTNAQWKLWLSVCIEALTILLRSPSNYTRLSNMILEQICIFISAQSDWKFIVKMVIQGHGDRKSQTHHSRPQCLNGVSYSHLGRLKISQQLNTCVVCI